jgi:AraC-like DNA-binding protein
MKEFIEFWIYFGVGLCFLLSLVNFLSYSQDSPEKKDLGLLAFLFGFAALRIAFYVNELILNYPDLILLFFCDVLLIGPVVLQIGLRITDFAIQKKISLKLHLIPAFLAIFFDVLFLTFNKEQKIDFVIYSLYKREFHISKLLYLFLVVHVLSYFLYLFYVFWKVSQKYKLNYSNLVWCILSIPSISILFLAYGFWNVNLVYSKVGTSLLTLTVIIIFILQTKYPLFFVTLQSEIQRKKYETTLLTEINVEEIKLKLHQLMSVEKVYRDEELRLQTLAKKLNLTSNQLSRILNENYQKNFNEFVNSFRIEEAKQKLVNEREKPIVNIAWEVGFRSKTSFHVHFLKNTKMTPVEFRKKFQN